MKVLLLLVIIVALVSAQSCTDPKNVAQKVAMTSDQTLVVDGVDLIALFVEVAPCLGITLPISAPLPCGEGCRNVTQNIAIGMDGCLLVNGTNILTRLQEIQMTCP